MTEEIMSPDDLVRVLGVSIDINYTLDELIGRFEIAKSRSIYSLETLRYAFKLARDPFFRHTFLEYGSRKIVDLSGFFDDGLPPGEIDQLIKKHADTYPIEKISRRLSFAKRTTVNSKGYVVLTATGSFAPMHRGHIEMMEIAREIVEREGYYVLGGIFIPEHDDYLVLKKRNGTERWPASKRLAVIVDRLNESDWLDADPWACNSAPTELLFTDMILRAQFSVNTALETFPSIKIVHVFGGDHAEYSRAFIRSGKCVCVGRRGYNADLEGIEKEMKYMGSLGTYFGRNTSGDISSTQIRQLFNSNNYNQESRI